jgi:hypothetical protein
VLQPGVLGGNESLESVDHLKAPWLLRGGDHAKRQLGEAVVTGGDGRSKRRVGCAELRQRSELKRINHRYSFPRGSRERIW